MRSLAPLATVRAVRQPEFGTLRELPSDFPTNCACSPPVRCPPGRLPTRDWRRWQTPVVVSVSEQVDSIENSLDSRSPAGPGFGVAARTEAQFATAFALMARSQGFPTRMVVGYSTAGKGRSRTVESTDVIVYPGPAHEGGLGSVRSRSPRDGARGVPVIRKVKPPEEGPAGRGDADTEPTPTPTPTPTPSPSPGNRGRRSHGTGHRCSRLRWSSCC